MRCNVGLFPRLWAAGLVLAGLVGCDSSSKNGDLTPTPTSRYPELPLRKVPPEFKNSVLECADEANTGGFPVSGYGLAVNLRGTAENTVPTPVRDYIIRQMLKRGFGQANQPGYENLQPDDVLRDPRVAIVRVDAWIPPGARSGQSCDVLVSAPDTSYTTSLAHGVLYRTDLRIDGANTRDPGGAVNVYVRCEGPVFVNPAYALSDATTQPGIKTSLRSGVIMDGGVVLDDRPIYLRLRRPQWSTSRLIESRIVQRFQAVEKVVAAQDEGLIHLFPPVSMHGDWEHFMGVVMHLYLNGSPEFAALKAKQLADEALTPDAPLSDISYAWEGLGQASLPFITPLMANPSPAVSFAAARAAAFLGDPASLNVLADMALSRDHPYQLNAAQTFGQLPNSIRINQILYRLLESDQALVRIEAYNTLSRNHDAQIFSKVIGEKFVLDIVPTKGPPLIYATRRGIPRLAIFGDKVEIKTPVLFSAMANRLTISSDKFDKNLTLYYRGESPAKPVQMLSHSDLAEVVARLGGEGAPGEARFDFAYADVVALVQALSQTRQLCTVAAGQTTPAAFVLQDVSSVQSSVYNAPPIPERARPQADGQPTTGTDGNKL